jgi:ABC-type Fe3+ transport system permease subunit
VKTLLLLLILVLVVLIIVWDFQRIENDAVQTINERPPNSAFVPTGKYSVAGLWVATATFATIAVALVIHPQPSFSRGDWLVQFLHAALTVTFGTYGPAVAAATLACAVALRAVKLGRRRVQ